MTAPFRLTDQVPFVPSVLDGMPFAAEFRYWTGGSGTRYLTRGFPLHMAGEFPGAPVILAAVDDDGRREAIWIGIAAGRRFEQALAATEAAGATEAHVHLLARGAIARVNAIHDLRAAVSARRENRPDEVEVGAVVDVGAGVDVRPADEAKSDQVPVTLLPLAAGGASDEASLAARAA